MKFSDVVKAQEGKQFKPMYEMDFLEVMATRIPDDEKEYVVPVGKTPYYVFVAMQFLSIESKKWKLGYPLTKTTLSKQCTRYGHSIISHDDQIKNIIEETNLKMFSGSSKPVQEFIVEPAKSHLLNCPNNRINLSVLKPVHNWINDNHKILGFTKSDLGLYCLLKGIAKCDSIPVGDDWVKELNKQIQIFEYHLNKRVRDISDFPV